MEQLMFKGLPAHHQRPAAPGPCPHEHLLDRVTLPAPPYEAAHGRSAP
jgi:hypothetical protein